MPKPRHAPQVHALQVLPTQAALQRADD